LQSNDRKENQSVRVSEQKDERPQSNKAGRSLADLRAVLSSISNTDSSGDASGNKKSDKKDNREKKESVPTPPPAKPAERRNELAEALGSLSGTGAVAKPSESVKAANRPIATTEPLRSPVETPASVTAKVELAKLAAEAEEAFKDLEAGAGVSAGADDPLAPKRIERMFRHTGNERSPFST
jgi:hypothetical protein